MQGGYGSNLARKFRTFFGSTANRVAGGAPLSVHSTAQASAQHNEHAHQLGGPRVSNSQPTMAMPSVASASMEPISGWIGESDHKTMTNRSVSEPDFSRNPAKVDFLSPRILVVVFKFLITRARFFQKSNSKVY